MGPRGPGAVFLWLDWHPARSVPPLVLPPRSPDGSSGAGGSEGRAFKDGLEGHGQGPLLPCPGFLVRWGGANNPGSCTELRIPLPSLPLPSFPLPQLYENRYAGQKPPQGRHVPACTWGVFFRQHICTHFALFACGHPSGGFALLLSPCLIAPTPTVGTPMRGGKRTDTQVSVRPCRASIFLRRSHA